ncbi:hypothetical protein E4P41_12090 [Geodermatophilus sp. DF01-2]|uniref:DUF6221 family protein n=1 Tax=Geodermatophilus sp. DF01-2 TaxID=2559610 RepID=UPI0010749306|nr:DUF6221 family protein [Geodermatophilus sp. DF01_2]TFV59302.1 hypothetical protein E4P41_12090 [Geodermatophilus sp. DF01_2]
MSPPHPDLPTSIRNEDLVDFLLTRFDEDEEAARFVALSPSRSDASLLAHVLRDVQAKRQLVRYFRDLERLGPRGATMEHALRLIGQTYADHPHYREEWRA